MRDGKHCSIRLLTSSLRNGVTYYRLQAKRGDCLCSIELRYSQLRKLAKLLPNGTVKFPEPGHLASFVSQLTGNAAFLQKRESELTLYFQAVSNEGGLEQSNGLAQLFLEGEEEILNPEEELQVPPPAPKIMGRKLSAKGVESIC